MPEGLMTNSPGSSRLSAAGSVGIGTRSDTFPAVHTTSSLRGSSACRSATRWRVAATASWTAVGRSIRAMVIETLLGDEIEVWRGGGTAGLVVGGAGEKWTVESRCDVYGPSATVESTFATRLRRARPRIRRA